MSKKNVLLLYKSKYGATKKYANLLQSRINCDLLDLNKERPTDFDHYDVVILAAGIYASGIAGMNSIRKNLDQLRGKEIAILCVGASPFEQGALEEIKSRNLKEDLKDVPVFYARGAWDESKMNFKDKLLCKMLHRMLKKKDPSSYEPWMKAFAESLGKQCDWVDEKNLQPLLDFLQEG